MSKQQNLFIISLGEIFTPNYQPVVMEFIGLIKNKKNNPNLDPLTLIPAITQVIKKSDDAIQAFKQGILSENEFNVYMLDQIQKTFDVEFTIEEFNQAWNKKEKSEQVNNLNYAKELIDLAKKEGNKFIIISYTNNKDIRDVIELLKKENIKIEYDYNPESDTYNLRKIGNVNVRLSYIEKIDGKGLLKKVIKEEIDTGKFSDQYSYTAYITGTNKIENEALREQLERDMSANKNVAHDAKIHVIEWDKKEEKTKTLTGLVENIISTQRTR
ncbi:MAG: hypothetical protein J0H68_07810 [Sphingobacteriia bacterium]|nr:hypothetical protein [Sphingobacteriia bacterium]